MKQKAICGRIEGHAFQDIVNIIIIFYVFDHILLR